MSYFQLHVHIIYLQILFQNNAKSVTTHLLLGILKHPNKPIDRATQQKT